MSRLLDVALARALGWDLVEYAESIHVEVTGKRPWREEVMFRSFENVPKYYTDGNAMLELDKEMRGRGWQLELNRWSSSEWVQANYFKENYAPYNVSQAKEEPLARALAAYKALTGKEWEEPTP